MAVGIFGSGVSALNAARIGLATAEHNISNANTPGYNRQQIIQSARLPEATGAGFIGQGVDVTTVRRIYNEFLTTQLLHEQALASQLETYYSQIQQLDGMLADQSAGLSAAIQDFFGAVNNVANSPESVAARQSMLSNAYLMVSRFHSMDQRLVDMNDSINRQMTSTVTNINSYAQQIASLNQNIALARAAYNGQPPNDMLDQRDDLISQLNQEIQASVVEQSDGSYNVFIGNGQPLVVGNTPFSLLATPSLADPSRLEVAYSGAGSSIIRLQQSSFTGGNLGGLLAFRGQMLDTARNSLGRLAMVMADTFNTQHQLGQDLYGALGGDFFAQSAPLVVNNTANTGTATVSVSISDYSALTASDYSLKFNGGTSYTLTRLSDNTVTVLSGLPQTVDGMDISTSAGALLGDSYLLRPTVNGARDFDTVLNDPSRIAAAAPVRTQASMSNTGTGMIAAGIVNQPPPGAPDPAHLLTDLNLQQPFAVTFNDPPATYSLTFSNATIGGTGTTVSVASTANLAVGAPVSGGGFPAGTTIVSITDATTFVTSAAAVPAAAIGQTLQLGSYPYLPGGVALTDASIAAPVATAATPGAVIGAGAMAFTPSASALGTLAAGTLTIQVGAGAPVSVGAITLDGVNNASNIAAALDAAYAAAGGTAGTFTEAAGVITKAADAGITFNFAITGTAANPAAAALTQATLSTQTGLTAAQLGTQAYTAQTVTVVSTAGLVVGAPVSGAGFPSGTTIVSLTATTFVVSRDSTLTTPLTGQALQVGHTFNGWTAQISGTPAAGDAFTISSNTGATTDSRNALLLASLQNRNTLMGETASYQGAYSQLVSLVGNKTRELEVTSTAQNNMVNQTVAAQQSVSGVNLDEEAADLMRYQRAYQAAGKAIQIADSLFDTLLSIGGR